MRSLRIISFFWLLALLNAEADEVKKEPCPSPFCLEPNWWGYFESDKDLNDKILEAVNELEKLQNKMPEDMQQETLPFVNQVAVNLNALPEIKNLKVEMPEPKTYSKNYSIDEYIEIAAQNHNLLKAIEEEEKELNEEIRKNAKTEKQLDALMASYRKLTNRTNERLLQGLKLYSLQSSYAIEKQKERLLKEKKSALLEESRARELELAYALSNLSITDSEKQLKKKLESLKKDLSMAELGSLHAEMSASSKVGESLKNEMAVEYSLQKTLSSYIHEAFIRLDILKSHAEIFFKKWLDKKIPKNDAQLEEKLSEWLLELEDIHQELKAWNLKVETTFQGLLHHNFDNTLFNTPKSEEDQTNETFELYEVANENLNNINKLKGQLAALYHLSRQMERILYEKSPFFHFFYSLSDAFSDFYIETKKFLNQSIFKVGDIPITLSSLIESFLIVSFAALFSFFLRKALKRFLTHKDRISLSSLFIIDRLVHYLLMLIGIAIALANLGLNFSSLMLVLGALSVGIGFGLQMIVNNFVSSLIILFSRNIKVNDYLQLSSGEWGQVTDINIQNTIIRTSDGIEVVVPNSELIAQKFVNWTMKDPYKRLHIAFGVAYGTDKELVKKAAMEAALEVPSTISNHPRLENPKVVLNNFGDNALEFELIVWVNLLTAKGSHGSLYSGYRWHLDDAFSKYGIVIPFPQRDIRVYSGSDYPKKKEEEEDGFKSFAVKT